MIFGVIGVRNKFLYSYLEKFRKRLKMMPFLKGEVLEVEEVVVFDIEPLIPPLHKVGILLLIGMLYFNNFTLQWYILIPLFFIGSSFFNSFQWYKFIMKIGLKKQKYTNQIQFLNENQLLKKVVYN